MPSSRKGYRFERIVVPTSYKVGPPNVYVFPDDPVTLFDCGPNRVAPRADRPRGHLARTPRPLRSGPTYPRSLRCGDLHRGTGRGQAAGGLHAHGHRQVAPGARHADGRAGGDGRARAGTGRSSPQDRRSEVASGRRTVGVRRIRARGPPSSRAYGRPCLFVPSTQRCPVRRRHAVAPHQPEPLDGTGSDRSPSGDAACWSASSHWTSWPPCR
jgi:hypothetical protein